MTTRQMAKYYLAGVPAMPVALSTISVALMKANSGVCDE